MKLNDTRLSMPPQQVSLDVLMEKYAKGDERSAESSARNARLMTFLPAARSLST